MAMRSRAGVGLVFGGLVAAGLVFNAVPGSAQTIIDQWSSVKVPAPPELKKVKADPQTTAFLVLDLINPICSDKPSCIDTLPKVAKFLDAARAHKMPVIYSETPGHDEKDILPQVAPKPGEPIVSFRADKFINTDLEKILKDRKISTVIVVGTSAQGAVLYTSSHAAFLGLKVIVPVDGMSSDPFGELATAWLLANAPGVGAATTLTSFDMIDW
jgi:nicotinamidase-related amidase